MRWSLSIILSAVVIFAASCDGQVPTADQVPADQALVASHGQPGMLHEFHASMSGFVSGQIFFPDIPAARCPNPSWQWIEFTVEGTIPHLGKVAGVVSHCSYVGTDNLPDGTYGDGEFVLVAANGDELWGTYDRGTSGPAAPGVFWWQDYLVFDGGTGRFAHASGSGFEWGTVDFSTSPPSLNYQMEGALSYDASDRRAD